MKLILLIIPLIIVLSSCFKDEPITEFSKVAGSWYMKKLTVQYFDSTGLETSSESFENIGYILLNYNDGESAENSFAYSIQSDDPNLASHSQILYEISTLDRWDVSVNAKHINFGYFDPVANGTYQVTAYSITKLTSNKMHWMRVRRHTSGSLKTMEIIEMVRQN